MKVHIRIRPVLGLSAFILTLATLFIVTTSAQSPIVWTEVLILSEPETLWSRPTIAADPWGQVHVFWAEKYGGDDWPLGQDYEQGNSLNHMVWDGQRWSEPLDIMVKDAHALFVLYPYATVGADGQIYLIWSGGNGLYFSRAPALNAHNAASWQPAQVIVEGSGVDWSRLVVGSGGQLYVVYAKLQGDLGGNVAYTWSGDNGATWSLPQAISEVYPGEEKASAAPQMILDDRGWLQVVWAERSAPDWVGHRILYSRSEDQGNTWASPQSLADLQPGEDWADSPSLAATADGSLHLVWLCGEGAPLRCYRASRDGGHTWSPRERILGELVGRGGWDAMIADRQGNLHLLALLRYPRGIYYAHKPAQDAWQSIRIVDEFNQPSFKEGHYYQVALSEGNQLHAVWQIDAIKGDVVYARITTSAPPLGASAVPTPAIASPPTTTPNRQTLTAVATSGSKGLAHAPVPPGIDDPEPISQSASPAWALLVGILPAAALITLILGLRLKR